MNRSTRVRHASGLMALGLLALAGSALAQRGSAPDDAYAALRNDTVWVDPRVLRLNLDAKQIQSIADAIKPLQLKVLVTGQLGGEWVRNGRERTAGFAKYVNDERLGLGDQGITIVLTPRALAGYSPTVSRNTLDRLNSNATRQALGSRDFTGGIVTLAQGIASESRVGGGSRSASTGYRTSSADRGMSTGGSLVTGAICLGIPALVGVALFASSRRAKAKRLEAAKQEAIRGKDAATDAIAFVDSYDGLISGPAADAVTQYRTRMGESYEKGLTALDGAKDETGYGEAKRWFSQSLTDFQASQKQIELATGGTGVAYRIPPELDDAQQSRAPMLEPVKGVSFFSSEPSDNLVPVEITLNGQRRTVMVTTAERDEFGQGKVPPIVGRQNGNQYQPWYDIDDYDPRRDYGRRSDLGYSSPWGMGGYGGGWGRYGGGWNDGFGNFLSGMALGSLFSGHYGGYGGYAGGWGGDTTIINNNYGGSNDSGGGGFDFGSGGDGNTGNDFGGGFDFGGGDSGGGGFDFGGGGDSGGGGGGDW